MAGRAGLGQEPPAANETESCYRHAHKTSRSARPAVVDLVAMVKCARPLKVTALGGGSVVADGSEDGGAGVRVADGMVPLRPGSAGERRLSWGSAGPVPAPVTQPCPPQGRRDLPFPLPCSQLGRLPLLPRPLAVPALGFPLGLLVRPVPPGLPGSQRFPSAPAAAVPQGLAEPGAGAVLPCACLWFALLGVRARPLFLWLFLARAQIVCGEHNTDV